MLVLDTDMLSIVQREEGPAYARVSGRLMATRDRAVVVTIISFEEQARGWLAVAARARTSHAQLEAYRRLLEFLQDFSRRKVLAFDKVAIARFEELRKARLRIGTMDLRISAITLAHDATLLSRNLKDFRRVPGLKVEDWTLP